MLKVDNLSYAYTDKYLFENLNLSLDIKTITKVSGSNGSGKTTFLKTCRPQTLNVNFFG